MIHMKNQALFSSKDKSKKLKCCLLQFLLGALSVNFGLFHLNHQSWKDFNLVRRANDHTMNLNQIRNLETDLLCAF